jgi:hypothetical protein
MNGSGQLSLCYSFAVYLYLCVHSCELNYAQQNVGCRMLMEVSQKFAKRQKR